MPILIPFFRASRASAKTNLSASPKGAKGPVCGLTKPIFTFDAAWTAGAGSVDAAVAAARPPVYARNLRLPIGSFVNFQLPSNICQNCFLPTNQLLTRLGGFMVLIIMSGAIYLHLFTWGHDFSRAYPAIQLFIISLYFIINPFKTVE